MNLTTHRVAVATYFFVSGFLHSNLLARLPAYQSDLGINNSVLGSLLFSTALGALIGMPIAGLLTDRYGTDKMTICTGILFCLFLPLIPLVSSVYFAAVLFFVMGSSLGSLDVCMNGQAVYIERSYLRPIMSSFHAVFSIGMACGAGCGALFSKFDISLTVHLWSMAMVSLGLVLCASFGLYKDIPVIRDKVKKHAIRFSLPLKTIVVLGLLAFCCMTGEGSISDWSAIYMNKIIGKNLAFSALAFGIFATGMTLGRLFGDSVTMRYGRRKILISDAILAIVGLGLVLGIQAEWSTLIGFFLVGIGLATIVPIVFSVAGNTPGVSPSVGIAMATSIGYTGFFIGPPVIGYLADIYDLRIGLVFTLSLFVLMFFLIIKYIKTE